MDASDKNTYGAVLHSPYLYIMTLQQFEYIVALDEEKHFQRAADRCFVTQPTLSMQVQKLEELLGVTLFDRKSSPIRATAAGEQVLKHAREALAAAKQVKTVARAFGDWKSGEFSLGIIPTMAPYILPRLLPALLGQYPQLRLMVDELETDQILERLKAQTLDMAILAGPLQQPEIRLEEVFFEPLMVYAALDHPLAGAGTISSDRLDSSGLWLLKKGHCLRIQMLNLCQLQPDQGDRRFIFESGSVETLKMMVTQNGGYTIVPALAAQNEPEPMGVYVPFTQPQPARSVVVATHHAFPGQGFSSALAKTLKSLVPEEFLTRDKYDIIGIQGSDSQ